MTREKYLATKNSTENATFPQKTAGISIFYDCDKALLIIFRLLCHERP